MLDQERLEKIEEDGTDIWALGNGLIEIGDWKFLMRGGSTMVVGAGAAVKKRLLCSTPHLKCSIQQQICFLSVICVRAQGWGVCGGDPEEREKANHPADFNLFFKKWAVPVCVLQRDHMEKGEWDGEVRG